MDYAVIWAIHCLGWFVLSYGCAVVRGGTNAIKISNAIAVGTVSTVLHILVVHYMGDTLCMK